MTQHLMNARALGLRYGVSRQCIHRWYANRARIGFPELASEDHGVKWWDVTAVDDWHASYVPDKGGAPKGTRNALSAASRARRAAIMREAG